MITTIYYVDDDSFDLHIFQYALSKINENVNLYSYSNPLSFLSELENISTENTLIILDINMPKKDGFEVLKEVREERALDQVPVVMFSTSDNPSSVSMSKEMGANSYTIKPMAIENLTDLIKQLIHADWQKKIGNEADFIIKMTK